MGNRGWGMGKMLPMPQATERLSLSPTEHIEGAEDKRKGPCSLLLSIIQGINSHCQPHRFPYI